ncbi:MAG: hypothetical protein GYA24_10800 [Candidatus Lokiarchaeota archaeon]|nr:hypothetical protein [Candidatus Lokiarchaeota archaeon]
MASEPSTSHGSWRLITLFAFIVVLGAGYLFSECFTSPLAFSFIMTETGQAVVFSMEAGDLLEIVTWSFGLVIAGYFLVRVNIEAWERHALMPRRKRDLLLHVFTIATLLIAGGNIIHVFFNQFDGMVEPLAGTNPDAWNLFVLVYFIDEHVSHAMLHAGILLVLGIVLASEPINDLPGELTATTARSSMVSMLLGFSMGAVQVLAALEGQCAIIVLAGAWAMLLALLVIHYKRGDRSFDTLRPFERPYLGFLACFAIAGTIVAVLWGLIFGTWPAYPFFKQPGELFG